MFKIKLTERVLKAVEGSPSGIASLDVLESLGLCSPDTLKTTLNRLGKQGRIIRVKRGVYSQNPIRDQFYFAQALFPGYLGFSSALYLHKLASEIPFTIHVCTQNLSKTRKVGEYEFRAVSLKGKAVGFERLGDLVVSTRAKTLFDCLYLPEYAPETGKLLEAYKEAKLTLKEWREFDYYVKRLAGRKKEERMKEAKRRILGQTGR